MLLKEFVVIYLVDKVSNCSAMIDTAGKSCYYSTELIVSGTACTSCDLDSSVTALATT